MFKEEEKILIHISLSLHSSLQYYTQTMHSMLMVAQLAIEISNRLGQWPDTHDDGQHQFARQLAVAILLGFPRSFFRPEKLQNPDEMLLGFPLSFFRSEKLHNPDEIIGVPQVYGCRPAFSTQVVTEPLHTTKDKTYKTAILKYTYI